jgi:hypothetical protein
MKMRTKLLSFKGGLLLPLIFVAIRTVFFSNWLYIVLAGVIASIFWILFNVFDQLIFFYPVFVFYLPDDAITGFIFSSISAVLMGIVVGMNVYVVKHSKKLKIGVVSLFSGSSLSVLSSTCASCSSIGFLLVSTFGGVGITASTFLTNYQIPLRIVSICLLIWALYSISKKLTKSCILKV